MQSFKHDALTSNWFDLIKFEWGNEEGFEQTLRQII